MGGLDKMIIYPNPSKGGQINIIHTPNVNSLIKIYDVLGKLVFTKKLQDNNGTHTLSVSFLQKGIYMVWMDSYSSKLVIE